MDKVTKYIVGIDEVGRGPIAGPVCVASFQLLATDYQLFIENSKKELKIPLRDSKKLSKKQREKWFEYLKIAKTEGLCDFSMSFVSSLNIDKFGISKCIKKALSDSLKKLKINPEDVFIFLDGGLHAPEEYVRQETVIKGDELHPIISLASIVAKISRDKVMFDYSKTYPQYGFDKHVGYGTKTHYEAVKKHGQTSIHRKTFIHN